MFKPTAKNLTIFKQRVLLEMLKASRNKIHKKGMNKIVLLHKVH